MQPTLATLIAIVNPKEKTFALSHENQGFRGHLACGVVPLAFGDELIKAHGIKLRNPAGQSMFLAGFCDS